MIARPVYVDKLISTQLNGRIKIITGIRRSGKSTLLFEIYKDYLLNSGVYETARKGTEKYYIQSALSMEEPEKQEAELRSLRAVKDSFKKIVISKSYGKSWIDDEGVHRINIIDFLLDADSLKR